MKKYLALILALLLIVVPFTARAEETDEPIVFYDDEYEDDYEDDYYDDDEVEYEVEDYYEEDDYYYYDDSSIMEADGELDTDAKEVTESCDKKLFTASNIIFLAVGVVTGAALTIVAVVCTKGKCKCGCDCECNKEEKKEKKNKKNDK